VDVTYKDDSIELTDEELACVDEILSYQLSNPLAQNVYLQGIYNLALLADLPHIEPVIDLTRKMLGDTVASCLEVALTVVMAITLKDLPHCIGVIFEGPPSSTKTTTLDLLSPLPCTYRSDDFSPRSMVSHYAAKTEEELDEIDLLPRIKHKCLLVQEMAPIFNARSDDLIKIIAVLTRVFDGRGYTSESGTHGRRGYEGEYLFTMCAATTPVPHRTWQALGKLGSRWLFCEVQQDAIKDDPIAIANLVRNDYRASLRECRRVVGDWVVDMMKTTGGFGSVGFVTVPDSLAVNLAEIAIEVSKWRGLLEKQDYTGYNPAQTEIPTRTAATLTHLARAHALAFRRGEVEWADVAFVRRLAYDSMPKDRRLIFRAFRQRGGQLATLSIQEILQCSKPTALKVMKEIASLGLVKWNQGIWEIAPWKMPF